MLAIVKRRSRFLLFVALPLLLFGRGFIAGFWSAIRSIPWPAWVLWIALLIVVPYIAACEALPFLTAAAPVAASVAAAGFQYATAAEQAKAKGADAATVEALGRLESTVRANDAKLLAACKAKPVSTARPLAAKVAADAAQDAELASLRADNAALRSQIAAMLARLDVPRSIPVDAGVGGAP